MSKESGDASNTRISESGDASNTRISSWVNDISVSKSVAYIQRMRVWGMDELDPFDADEIEETGAQHEEQGDGRTGIEDDGRRRDEAATSPDSERGESDRPSSGSEGDAGHGSGSGPETDGAP